MTLREALQKVQVLQIPENSLPVEKTCVDELQKFVLAKWQVLKGTPTHQKQKALRLQVKRSEANLPKKILHSAPEDKSWAYFCMSRQGDGELFVSHPAFLYAYTVQLLENWLDQPVSEFENGKYFTAAFKWHRPLFDYLLTQSWRTARHFDPEAHIREMARCGYTHFEVNGLAMPVPFEDPVPGEYYSQFYTYCAALDQFVQSELNRGIYPIEYLTANLNLLKKYAATGRKYGLQPGILCFEPRSVPEKLLQKYPTLRGARVDHPFRSRRPRYNLTLAHPMVQDHYRQMMQNLLKSVPDLAYMSIWSNDSGAGFEYTSSLYVGRNGGPYLIREWRTHEQIAEVAGKNIVRFMKLLREAAAEINPDFHISLRLEPFKVEHDIILDNLEAYLDIEVPSLLVRGYDLPYCHEKYPDIKGIAGSIHHIHLDEQEKEILEKQKKRKITAHLIYSHGNGYNLEPLVGIPFPWLLWQKLQAMCESKVEFAANLGGFVPASIAPFQINQEIFRAFQLTPEMPIDKVIREKAKKWAGEAIDSLIQIWKLSDETIRWLPPLPLYSHFGFVWLRTWIRPIIPDLQAIPEKDRRYYETFMVSTDNNPNLVDLGRDVLFELISQEYGEKFVQRVDQNVSPKLDQAITLADQMTRHEAISEKAKAIFVDQRDRLRALQCWIGTQRSTAAWVAGVHGYLGAKDKKQQTKWRQYLDDMTTKEIQNTADLLKLWATSDVDFMVVSQTGETSYIYGENFGDLLQRKIELMKKYRHVEPRIKEDILWKI